MIYQSWAHQAPLLAEMAVKTMFITRDVTIFHHFQQLWFEFQWNGLTILSAVMPTV